MAPHADQPPFPMKGSQGPDGGRASPADALPFGLPKRPLLAKSDFAPVCLTFFVGLGFCALLPLAIARWYRPDTARLIQEATKLVTPAAARALAPEPVERLQYVAVLLLGPPFLLACLLTLTRFYRTVAESSRLIYLRAATGLLLAATVATPVLAYLALKNSAFLYVRAGVLFTHWPSYTFLLFPCLALLAFFAEARWISWIGRLALYSTSAYMAATVFFSVLFDRDNISPWTPHLNPVIYPLAQVMAGKTLLVNCAPLYGLYPQFLQPVYQIFPLSVYSFTVVMAVLLMVCLVSQWFFLRAVTKNNFVLLAGFVAAVFYSYVAPKVAIPKILGDPYFQYWPIRVLFASLLLALSAFYLRGIGRRVIYPATFLCAALATLWNLDSGLVVFGAWLLLLVYIELFHRPWRDVTKPILSHVLAGFCSLLLVYGGYSLFAFLRSGVWPDWHMTANYYRLFSHYGYFMLPMAPLPHMWGIVVGVYIGAMVLAIVGLLRKEDELFSGSLFLLAILGAGLFGYYNGRSHDYCVIPLLYVPIMIMTLVADHILTGVKAGDRAYRKFLPLGALLFYFCASAVPSVLAFGQLRRFKGWVQAGSIASIHGSQGVHSRNIAFIRKQTKPGERVLIFLQGKFDGMYYAESSTASVLDLASSSDWFFKSDIERIVGFLRENKTSKVFAVPGEYGGLAESFASYRIAAQESAKGLAMLLPGAAGRAAVKTPVSVPERDP